MALKPQQLATLLAASIPAGLSILIKGAPGSGKTEIVHQAAASVGYDVMVEIASMADPTDYKGLPTFSKDQSTAKFVPFDNLERICMTKTPLAVFLDDLGQAPPAIQSAIMHPLQARRINGHKIPDHVTFIAATNDRGHKAGVQGLLEPLKARFNSIVELETDLDAWCGWALRNGVGAMQVAFLRYRSELLSAFNPTQDLTNSPSPRTWFKLSQLERLGLPAAIESEAFAGAVGAPAATEYIAFRTMANSLVNLDAILLDPAKAKIPTKPSELYATSVGLASRANVTNFSRIATYCERMVAAGKGEFAVLCIRDAIRRDEKLTHTETFVSLSTGQFGQLISGN